MDNWWETPGKEKNMKKYNKEQYQQGKEKARNEAIEWQMDFAKYNPLGFYSWEMLLKSHNHFKKLGKRYGLLREFHENGIC